MTRSGYPRGVHFFIIFIPQSQLNGWGGGASLFAQYVNIITKRTTYFPSSLFRKPAYSGYGSKIILLDELTWHMNFFFSRRESCAPIFFLSVHIFVVLASISYTIAFILIQVESSSIYVSANKKIR